VANPLKDEQIDAVLAAMGEALKTGAGQGALPFAKSEECRKKEFSLKRAAFIICTIGMFLCIGGGYLCSILGWGDSITLFTAIGATAAGGIIAVCGCVATSDFSKSKYYQPQLDGK